MLTVSFDEYTMSIIQVQSWYNRFKEKREVSVTMIAVKKMILDNRRITIREVADYVGISIVSCQAISTDVLGMNRTKFLNFEQRQRRIHIAQEMLTTLNSKKKLTGDESFVYGYNIETKAQSS